jgi:hypothetical protein
MIDFENEIITLKTPKDEKIESFPINKISRVF